MADLVNELVWSHSRSKAFAGCKRAYWFNYYGSWGGWDAAAPTDVRDAYVQKKLTTRAMWTGTVVHQVAEDALRRVRDGDAPRPVEQVVAAVHRNPAGKHAWTTELLGAGDIDRVIIEWRSMLRQIGHAPELSWPRWRELQSIAKSILQETESPTLTDLPPLEFHQTRRVDHRLILRRH